MARFVYPSRTDLELFVGAILKGHNPIEKFLPSTGEAWLSTVSDCIAYVAATDDYAAPGSFLDAAARLLYKCVKKHELADGNKRSAVIAVYLFALLNDYEVKNPEDLKRIAKGVASTKGRANEGAVCARLATNLSGCLMPLRLAEAA